MSTATQALAVPRNSVLTRARDYAELTKLRVTTLIVMTAWCGYYFGALKSGNSSLSWHLFHALLGIALWLGWIAFMAGWRPQALEAQAPGFVPHLHPTMLIAALALSALWLYGLRLQPKLDFYNVFNSATVLLTTSTFPNGFLRPTQILGGRLIKFAVQADF